MRLQLPAISSLALLLAACSVETGNDANNAAGIETSETGVAAAEDEANADRGAVPRQPAPAVGQPVAQQPPGNGQLPEPSGQVTLSASPARTMPGATMTLTLRNRTRERIGYNLCTSTLQTSGGKQVPTGRVCTMELRTLEPGRSANYSYGLPGILDSGTYRFVTNVERMSSSRRETISSNNFQVR